MRSSMRREWQALGIGFAAKMLLLVVEALTRTPQIPGRNPGHPPLWFLHYPGFTVQLVAQTILPIMWSLHPIALQVLSIAADLLAYSAIAYLALRLLSARKTARVEPGIEAIESAIPSRRARFTRRLLLALASGLAVAGMLLAFQNIRLTRAIPNGQETLPIDQAYPALMELGFPGVVLLILAINTTEVMWGSHPILAQAVASTGNFLFYSLAAYVVLRVTAQLLPRRRT